MFEILELWNAFCEGVSALREDVVCGVLPAVLEDPGEASTGDTGGEALRRVLSS